MDVVWNGRAGRAAPTRPSRLQVLAGPTAGGAIAAPPSTSFQPEETPAPSMCWRGTAVTDRDGRGLASEVQKHE